MNHDEYLSRLEMESDEGALSILAHVSSCPACRGEQRAAEGALSRLEPGTSPRLEEICRVAAAVAVVAIAALGLRPGLASKPAEAPAARYRIVGDASGVVAYTPRGTLTAVSFAPGKEISR
jgi:hypothetical protein